ncbi:MAG: prepilin-type cleavage/methylation domain-containing protein, partial [Verrucomicrobiota bacterium]
WTVGSYNTNTAYVANDNYSSIATYLAHSPNVFACPAENYLSTLQLALGWTHRARSVAMNAAVGNGAKYNSPNPFGWTQWYVAKKATDFKTPAPSQSFVFTDEHPDSIDDILIYVAPYPVSEFTELPGNQHDGAAGMTFADGHVEMHKWTGTVIPNKPVAPYTTVQRVPCSITDPDMLWLAQHTPQSP